LIGEKLLGFQYLFLDPTPELSAYVVVVDTIL